MNMKILETHTNRFSRLNKDAMLLTNVNSGSLAAQMLIRETGLDQMDYSCKHTQKT